MTGLLDRVRRWRPFALHTSIGAALAGRPVRLALATLLAVGAICVDVYLAWEKRSLLERAPVPLFALLGYLVLARGDARSLGLRLAPAQGFRYWIKGTLLIGLAVGAIVSVTFGVWKLMGRRIPVVYTSPDRLWPAFVNGCLVAPVVEELTYRFTLCTPLGRVIRLWPTILLSGAVFAGLHFVYGVASPENFVAGFFFAWVYFKSGTIWLPMALHFLGNLFALGSQLVGYYYLLEHGRYI